MTLEIRFGEGGTKNIFAHYWVGPGPTDELCKKVNGKTSNITIAPSLHFCTIHKDRVTCQECLELLHA